MVAVSVCSLLTLNRCLHTEEKHTELVQSQQTTDTTDLHRRFHFRIAIADVEQFHYVPRIALEASL